MLSNVRGTTLPHRTEPEIKKKLNCTTVKSPFPIYATRRLSLSVPLTPNASRHSPHNNNSRVWVGLGQHYQRVDVVPVSYAVVVDAMSSEKLAFVLDAVFTVGPKIGCGGNHPLLLYSKLVAPRRDGSAQQDESSGGARELVEGVIEGRTRVLAAGMTMEQITHQEDDHFIKAVIDHVQLDLDKFGLCVYNANFKKVSYVCRKPCQGAVDQAMVDMAVADKEREGSKLQKAAEVDAQTMVFSARHEAAGLKERAKAQAEVKVVENEREALVVAAMGKLAEKAGWEHKTKLAEVEAAMAVAIREAELQVELERSKAKCVTEKLSKAAVAYDTQMLESNAALYGRQKAAEAAVIEQAKAAEARKAQAEARFLELKLAEDAKLYASQKHAESLAAVGGAKAAYVASMLGALGGDHRALRDYLMVDGGLYYWHQQDASGAMQEVSARAQAQAAATMPPAWMGGLATITKGVDGRSRLPI